MLWKSKNIIRLKFQICLQIWRTGGSGGGDVDIDRVWEGIRKNLMASATETLRLLQHKTAKTMV
jgi:hypothetical protein